ncbi:MAG TPA: M57 family metalloprotease [Cyclobacteriaceae bacterium]
MKNFRRLIILVLFGIILFSCNIEEVEKTEFVFETSRVLEDYEMPNEDIELLQQLGFAGSSGIVMEKTQIWNGGATYIYYLMEGDIEIRKDLLKSMVDELPKNGKVSQYRTANLVGGPFPRTIRVIGMNMNNTTLQQGLTMAIQNYNNENINLNFTLEFRTVTNIWQSISAVNDSDILAQQYSGSAGGNSGFPSGGNPYANVNVSTSTASFGTNVCENVFTHEIGHTIGLRHTDFFNRSISCGGSFNNEGDTGVGAIHIPGTPATTSIDMNSIMLSCFNAGVTGEFSNFDVTALEGIY